MEAFTIMVGVTVFGIGLYQLYTNLYTARLGVTQITNNMSSLEREAANLNNIEIMNRDNLVTQTNYLISQVEDTIRSLETLRENPEHIMDLPQETIQLLRDQEAILSNYRISFDITVERLGDEPLVRSAGVYDNILNTNNLLTETLSRYSLELDTFII